MLNLNGYDIEMAKSDDYIFNYLDGFFDIDSLLYYIRLSLQGHQIYKENNKGNIIKAILMCTIHNKDYRKYERFELKCEEWDLYFNDAFIGFDKKDVNMAIAELVARDIEKMI